MSPGTILAAFIFGMIGVGAWIHGRKQGEWRPMLIGVALMAYPYFVSGARLTFLIGAALTAALFVWRE